MVDEDAIPGPEIVYFPARFSYHAPKTIDDAVKLLQEGHSLGQILTKFEWGGDFGTPDET